MKKLNKEEREEMDKILKMVGETLISAMKCIDAENFLECTLVGEKDEKYKLKIERIK